MVGPGIVGSEAFTALDLSVPGHPGASLQAVFAIRSLTAFGIPGAGTHTTVVDGMMIVSSTAPALVGEAVAAPALRAMVRAGRSASGTTYAPLIHAEVVEAFRPVPGSGLGVFFSVTTKVAYAAADDLARVLLIGYLVLLGIVVALAALVVGLLRRRDRAAEAAAQHYRALAEATPDGVGIVDDQAHLVYANPALITMIGLGETETWQGHPVSEWNDLTSEEWLESRAAVVQRHETLQGIMMHLRRSDGCSIAVEANSGPFDLGGRPGVISVIRDLSESRAAEAAVVAAEAAHRTTIETVAEGIIVYDLDGNGRPTPVRMNPAAVSILGRPLDELQASWMNAVRADLVDTDRCPIQTADLPVAVIARTGEPTSGMVCGVPDGTGDFRWVRTVANPIRDRDDVMIGIVACLVDITAERADSALAEADRARFAALATAALDSERALRESEERFRSAFEHAPIAKALIGLDGRYDQVNQAMCELIGYGEAQLHDLTLADITHPEDLDAEVAAMERLLAGEITQYTLEKRFLTAAGGVVWASKSSSLIRRDDGSPLHFIAQIQDITERREHEQTLADERRRLRDAQAIGHVGSWEMDLVTRSISWSDTFLELYGLDRDSFTGEPADVTRSIHPDDRDRMAAAVADCVATGAVLHARYRVRRQDDGGLRWLDLRGARHRDRDNLRVAASVVDVTELVLAAQQVEEARDAALEASKQKSAFLATMSHEIRTPMNAVIGMTGLLLDTPLGADQREFVETVRSSGDALLGIINDILDFSKIEAGGLKLEHRPFDLHDCVEDALDLVAATSHAKGIELVGDIDGGCPAQVVGDVTRLRQVLVNLLGNALKFTARGEVVLRVAPDGDLPGGQIGLRVSVADTGIGIPADRLAGLFESFSQVDTSTTRVYGGTGLGLAISQRLVEAMGGALSVESTAGVGSTFAFSIALDATPAADAVAPTVLHGQSVLIVDDNQTNRRILGRQMAGWGMVVVEAGSGPDAIAAAATDRPFDIAVLDMQMPGMTGHELAEALRAAPATRYLPLVLLSSSEGRLALPRPDMFAAVLTKPVRGRRLHEGLEHALRPVATPSATVSLPAEALSAGRTPLRILLAEDNAVNQRLGRLMLEKLGDHVDVVGNGLEATDAVRLVPYDAVLMDVEMPVMDGLEATRAIRRALPVQRQPQIIAMTASALVEDRQACYDAGMDDYLAKPVRLADLDAALGKASAHLQRRTTPSSGDGPGTDGPGGAIAVDAVVIDTLIVDLGDEGTVLVAEVIATYLRESEDQVTTLRNATATQDLQLAGSVAHKLQSSTALLGAVTLAGLLRDACAAARHNGVGLDKLTSLVEAEHRRVVSAMAITLQRLAP